MLLSRPPWSRPGATLTPVLSTPVVYSVPTGAGYSLLLVGHVGAAVVGFGALALTGFQARRARLGPSAPGADGVRRYFRPGVNWAGRALYAVPVLGFALVADSHRAFSAGDGFVVAGLVLWLAAAALAEVAVWPAERRVQLVVTQNWDDPVMRAQAESACRTIVLSVLALTTIFVAGVVIMVGKP